MTFTIKYGHISSVKSANEYQKVIQSAERIEFAFLLFVSIIATGLFWTWLVSSLIVNSGFIWSDMMILVFFFIPTILPYYAYWNIWNAKKVVTLKGIPSHWRIAAIVTKAPSEPFSIIQETLRGMMSQSVSCDVWIADEHPAKETIDWCEEHEVNISTRKDVTEYHQERWPRRTKCKEGNLAYFYDTYGFDKYDFVSQFDADHIPDSDYLENILLPFIDDEVGYVAAPSITDANKENSWAVRARLYNESIFHGAMQAGQNGNGAPLCIGSHYAVRTKALREIGGIGPEFAEDYSTTFSFLGNSWKGVFAFDAIAHGHGAGSFTDLVMQDFRWARSLSNLSLNYLSKFWKRLTLRQRIHYVFTQSWYGIIVVYGLLSILIPALAITTNTNFLSVPLHEFLWIAIPSASTFLLIAFWFKRQGLCRPKNIAVISWEDVLFQFARWPWVLMALFASLGETILGLSGSFGLTPKGDSEQKGESVVITFPFVVIIALLFMVLISSPYNQDLAGYRFMLRIMVIVYAFLVLSVHILHLSETHSKFKYLDIKTHALGVVKIFAMVGFFVVIFAFIN